ncbi:hypothetical protein PHAVU_005G181100 [Phaseolus vulgaris]|uniref:BZIP domain-containing protein n=1 Tax=Phaseolus vulgaris TaxID=3885 RepID=V7BXQ8_PHAVU|nr:hypothetical protein PHAVU_005G181100g [Phaseolus vulgaris]ESW22787.1 hypothetical protein PHAVU_005G181100g [Phaseolus vulgaris]
MFHDDDWVNLAVADDSLVVNLLLRLHHPPPPPLPPLSVHLHWTVRQRRSRSVRRHAPHKKPESTRASPTTPLSWSGATSASGGNLDGYEESSRPTSLPQTSRSKVSNPSETATTRKSRRKKTLAELKDAEDLLLKERRSLKKELASLRLTVEQHRTTNESLKRVKLDFVSRQNSNTSATASEVCGKAVNGPSQFATSECHPSSSVSRNTAIHDVSPVYAANVSPKAQENGNQESSFVLPDLNLPVDEDFSANAMH